MILSDPCGPLLISARGYISCYEHKTLKLRTKLLTAKLWVMSAAVISTTGVAGGLTSCSEEPTDNHHLTLRFPLSSTERFCILRAATLLFWFCVTTLISLVSTSSEQLFSVKDNCHLISLNFRELSPDSAGPLSSTEIYCSF